MPPASRPSVRDFGFDPAVSTYHFALVVGRDGAAVQLEERFELPDDESGADGSPVRPAVPKAVLDGYRWSRIAEPARVEFNRRIQPEGVKAAKWRADATLLAPHLGKELALLCWAVEDADPSVIPNVVANWIGLAPEERWWLYTTVNATAGHPEHGRDRGWRKAVKIALAENPAAAATPGGWLTRVDVDRPDGPAPRSTVRGRRGVRDGVGDQLTLLADESPAQLTLEGSPRRDPGARP